MTGRVAPYGMSGGGTPFRSFTAIAGAPDAELASGNLAGSSAGEIVVSARSQVHAYDAATGATLTSLAPFPEVTGRVAVAVGDVDFAGPVATMRDPTPFSLPTQFTATILWGDGGRSAGAIRRRGMSLEVVGIHRYRRAGVYSVVVRITDKASTRRTVVRSTIRVR